MMIEVHFHIHNQSKVTATFISMQPATMLHCMCTTTIQVEQRSDRIHQTFTPDLTLTVELWSVLVHFEWDFFFSSLAAPEVIMMTTSGAASNEKIINITTLLFQWMQTSSSTSFKWNHNNSLQYSMPVNYICWHGHVILVAINGTATLVHYHAVNLLQLIRYTQRKATGIGFSFKSVT